MRIVHSTGGGEVARYIGRHGTSRLSKAVLLGAVAPLMLKTDANLAENPSRHVANRAVSCVRAFRRQQVVAFGHASPVHMLVGRRIGMAGLDAVRR